MNVTLQEKLARQLASQGAAPNLEYALPQEFRTDAESLGEETQPPADAKVYRITGLSEIEVEDLVEWLRSQGKALSLVQELRSGRYLVEWPKKV